MNSEKYIGLDVHQATISVGGIGFPRQVNAWNRLWRRKRQPLLSFLRGYAEHCRSRWKKGRGRHGSYDAAQAPRCQPGSVQSAEERSC